jgi:hypothetical protein
MTLLSQYGRIAGIFDTAASKAGTLEVPLAIPKK